MLLAVPRCRDYHVRGCMPSDEIALLLESINRESADGKRDFAAMSLAAVSGLRAGDMASWKPDEIGWKKHEIRLVQGKTAGNHTARRAPAATWSSTLSTG